MTTTTNANDVSVEVDFADDECDVATWGATYASDDVQVEATTNDVGRPAMRLTGPATSLWATLVVWAGGDEDEASEVMNDAS